MAMNRVLPGAGSLVYAIVRYCKREGWKGDRDGEIKGRGEEGKKGCGGSEMREGEGDGRIL